MWWSQGKTHKEIIACCGTWQWQESPQKTAQRVKYKPSRYFHLLALEIDTPWLRLILLVCLRLQSRWSGAKTSKHCKQHCKWHLWLIPGSQQSYLVLKYALLIDLYPPSSGDNNYEVISGFSYYTSLLVWDMPEMSWFAIDCFIRLVCIFTLLLL